MKIWGLNGSRRGRNSFAERWYAAQYQGKEYVFQTDLPTTAEKEYHRRGYYLQLADVRVTVWVETYLKDWEAGMDPLLGTLIMELQIKAPGKAHTIRLDWGRGTMRYKGNPMEKVAAWAIENFPDQTNPDKR